MSESARTLTYAGVAVVSVIGAGLFGYLSQPARVTGFEAVGTEFYPDFRVASDADSLRVVSFDADTATIRQFSIAQGDDGQWVIPSHSNYPADAADRLNKTANSIIGIKKGAQKGSRESQHKELGVLDPLSEETDFDGRGQRVTLKKGDDVLVDYIIGKKANEEDGANLYYVRMPKEPEVFIAEIDLDLSTKFSDWIEDDLLKVDSGDLREVIVNKYSVDEQRGLIRDQEVSTLTREKSFGDWKLEGLNEETEEVKKKEVDDMVSAIDNLKIVGVRSKPKGINADLSVDPEIVKSQGQFQMMQIDLQEKGFFIQPTDPPKLYANEGNVMAATAEGVVYTLNFGEVVSGTQEEIEIGAKKKDDEKKGEDSPADSESNSNNRYLFVTAAFDKKYLEEPTKPAEPQMPEGLVLDEKEKADEGSDAGGEPSGDCGSWQEEDEKEQEEQKSEEAQTEKKEAATEQEVGEAGAQPAGDKQAAEEKPESEEDKQKRLKAEWDKAQATYKSELQKYEADLKAFEEKVEQGEKKVDDLNYRFGGWYYVISDDSFATLRLARTDLVKPKEKKEDDKKDAAGAVDPADGGAAKENDQPEVKPGEAAKGDNGDEAAAAPVAEGAAAKVVETGEEKPDAAKPKEEAKEPPPELSLIHI